MEVMEFEELKRSTNPSQAHYSTLHPLFSRATSHVTTPLVQRKFYVTAFFALKKMFRCPLFYLQLFSYFCECLNAAIETAKREGR